MEAETPAKILIADDDDMVRSAVEKILHLFGHEVISVPSGEHALEVVDSTVDVIVLDINMPGMDGFETMQAINQKEPEIPVIFLTGAGCMEYAVKAINLGAYDFINKPVQDLDIFNIKIRRAIEKRTYVLREKRYKQDLESEVAAKTKELAAKNKLLQEYSENLEVSTVNTMMTLQTALEEKDPYTAGHTTRVTQYSMMIAKAMKLDPESVEVLERACQVHDIGKLVIDVSYIHKPGPLSDEEWTRMKQHPVVGANIIKPLTFMQREVDIVRHHHERMDGKGYPDGIGGGDLDRLTKIITVADSFDAMTSKRSYKKNLTWEEGMEELAACRGTQFDPEVVNVFTSVLSGKLKKRKEI